MAELARRLRSGSRPDTTHKDVTVPTTLATRPVRKAKPTSASAERVKRTLLELAYRLHTTKVVGQKAVPNSAG